VAFVLGPALVPGRALLGVDLLQRFPPWEALVDDDWEASNHLLFDQASQFYPWRLEARRLAAAGLPPLWNRSAGAGSPLLANQQSATLAPVELAVSWLDPRRAPAVAAAIRLLIAGLGMVALARALGVGPAARFAALAFGSGSIAPSSTIRTERVRGCRSWCSSRCGWPRARACGSWRSSPSSSGQSSRAGTETSLYLASPAPRLRPRRATGGRPAGRLAGLGLLTAAHLRGAGSSPQISFLEYLWRAQFFPTG
jgi:hypothetical protein